MTLAMKTHRFGRAATQAATLAVLPCLLLVGCKDAKEHRASVEFHAEAVRNSLAMLRRTVRQFKAGELKEPSYDMRIVTDLLDRALYGLPERIEKRATTRVEERKAAAVKARKLFQQLRPKLDALSFEEAEANAMFDVIASLLDEVERE